MTKLAVVQKASKFLDKNATINSAVALIDEAASNGTELIVFTEAFIPGYPAWIWRLRPGADWGISEELHARLSDNAVDLSSNDLSPLYDAAKRNNVTIVCGINEKSDSLSRATLYNTSIIIGADGSLLNRHRKLMPTNPERMVWGIEIYIAPTYDSGDNWIDSLKHIAREGCCWVVGCGNIMRASDIPDDFPEKENLYPDNNEWVNSGDSVVISPAGEIVAGPKHEEEGILYCEVDIKQATYAKRALDVTGHYARPDIFTLHVNTKAQTPVEFD